MKVIKKLGFRQDFKIEKIKDALQRTAKTINLSFTNSDWKEFKPRVEARLNPIMVGKDEIYSWEIDDIVIDAILRSRFKEIAKEYISTRSRLKRDKLNDLGLSPVAMKLLKERYLKKDDKGEPIETAKEMMCRVARAIASAEKTESLRDDYTEKFTSMLTSLNFLPNSPCLVAAGTGKKGTLAACFGYSVEDSLDSIFDVLHLSAKTFQMGGGVGINISKLRESNSLIKSSNGVSSGPIVFMEMFNTMVETVKAGGFRRGALLVMMDYTHPDIEEFITCKKTTDKLNNMNISVAIDDKFIEAVEKDDIITLISPKDNKSKKVIQARLLLELIAHHMWDNGEPGILYMDTINKANPTPHLGQLDVVNPCSESTLRGTPPGESCNLGSINLMNHLREDDIDWDKLAETTKLAIRFLDNMIDMSLYPSKSVDKAVKETRKIGLGIMGFADLLISLNIKYSSSQAVEFAGKIMSFINDVASQYSTELGNEKGLYSEYKEGCPKRRNAVVTTIAPTGSISLICGISSGIEPNFAKEYSRSLNGETINIVHPMKNSDVFEMTYDIQAEQHLNILAEFQKHNDNSTSKTLNLPENITVREIKELVLKAHKLGCKGITIFRQNCNRDALIKCESCNI